MKIFIIGKNGQLGSELNRNSKKLGNETFAFGRDNFDVCNYDAVREKIEHINPDVVINTAAYHVVSDCEKYPDKAFVVNTAAQKNLASICREKKIKLVYCSTDKVFDGKSKKPYKETAKPNPIQIYGVSKLAGEIITLNYCPNSLVIRTCGIFGGIHGSRIKGGNFVLYILSQAKTRDKLEISSEQIANFVYADDLAKAILTLLNNKNASGIFNIVNEGYAPWSKFAQEIVKIRKLDLEIVPVNRHGVYSEVPTPVFTALDTSKAVKVGIKLPRWRDSLKRYLDFLKTNGI
jgi:dTDP-4-dehydrorhamnose reductase